MSDTHNEHHPLWDEHTDRDPIQVQAIRQALASTLPGIKQSLGKL